MTPPLIPRPTDLRRAALFMVVSAFAFSLMGGAVKLAAGDVPETGGGARPTGGSCRARC